jgi:hypothetical protein
MKDSMALGSPLALPPNRGEMPGKSSPGRGVPVLPRRISNLQLDARDPVALAQIGRFGGDHPATNIAPEVDE